MTQGTLLSNEVKDTIADVDAELRAGLHEGWAGKLSPSETPTKLSATAIERLWVRNVPLGIAATFTILFGLCGAAYFNGTWGSDNAWYWYLLAQGVAITAVCAYVTLLMYRRAVLPLSGRGYWQGALYAATVAAKRSSEQGDTPEGAVQETRRAMPHYDVLLAAAVAANTLDRENIRQALLSFTSSLIAVSRLATPHVDGTTIVTSDVLVKTMAEARQNLARVAHGRAA